MGNETSTYPIITDIVDTLSSLNSFVPISYFPKIVWNYVLLLY